MKIKNYIVITYAIGISCIVIIVCGVLIADHYSNKLEDMATYYDNKYIKVRGELEKCYNDKRNSYNKCLLQLRECKRERYFINTTIDVEYCIRHKNMDYEFCDRIYKIYNTIEEISQNNNTDKKKIEDK